MEKETQMIRNQQGYKDLVKVISDTKQLIKKYKEDAEKTVDLDMRNVLMDAIIRCRNMQQLQLKVGRQQYPHIKWESFI